MAKAGLMTRKEVSRRLNISVATLKRWEKKARIPYIKLDTGRVRYEPEEIEKYIQNRIIVKGEK
jgi:excisionase family DNA binding protein